MGYNALNNWCTRSLFVHILSLYLPYKIIPFCKWQGDAINGARSSALATEFGNKL